MVEQRQAQRRGRVLGGVRPTSEDHRATPFELFFDLVYVFAVTQVTGYMAAEHSAHGVLQGLLLLTLLWWTWSGYTWLGNQARADEGLLRAGMVVAMAAMFVVALDHSRGVAGRARRPERAPCAGGRLPAGPLRAPHPLRRGRHR
jgi:low temperature requirement protein LtrA